MKPELAILLIATLCLFKVNCFSVSVPSTRAVCKAMIPGHEKHTPQQSPSPFNLTTDLDQVKDGGVVEVSINAPEGQKFKGFYIQARDHKGNPVGQFIQNAIVKTHNCGGKKSNAAHHMSPEEKSKVQVSWNPPPSYKGTIQFQATVVQQYTTFWTPVKADLVTVA